MTCYNTNRKQTKHTIYDLIMFSAPVGMQVFMLRKMVYMVINSINLCINGLIESKSKGKFNISDPFLLIYIKTFKNSKDS